jgi:hypothetical protein
MALLQPAIEQIWAAALAHAATSQSCFSIRVQFIAPDVTQPALSPQQSETVFPGDLFIRPVHRPTSTADQFGRCALNASEGKYPWDLQL